MDKNESDSDFASVSENGKSNNLRFKQNISMRNNNTMIMNGFNVKNNNFMHDKRDSEYFIYSSFLHLKILFYLSFTIGCINYAEKNFLIFLKI